MYTSRVDSLLVPGHSEQQQAPADSNSYSKMGTNANNRYRVLTKYLWHIVTGSVEQSGGYTRSKANPHALSPGSLKQCFSRHRTIRLHCSMIAPGIVKRDLTIPSSAAHAAHRGRDNPLVFVLENVYSKEECAEFIRQAEERGFEDALVNIGFGRQVSMSDVRHSARCIWDSDEKAGELWRRIKPYIPEIWRERKVLGLNERLRILRYDPGGYFKPHRDGSFTRDNGSSLITVQLYLNEGYNGGSTTFVSLDNVPGDRSRGPLEDDVPHIAKTGDVLVFEHPLWHEGSQLISGRKYNIRTDVMYTAQKVTGSA